MLDQCFWTRLIKTFAASESFTRHWKTSWDQLGTEPELPEVEVNVETHPVPDLHSFSLPAGFICVSIMSIKSTYMEHICILRNNVDFKAKSCDVAF